MSAPELSDDERAVVDRFEAADPAPESFDATAALRRVLALAEWASSRHAPQWFSDSEMADRIRAAVEGDQ